MFKKSLLIALLGSTIIIGANAADVPRGTKLASEQSLNWRILDDPASFDPGINSGTDGSSIIRNIFEGLYNQDANGNLIPALAESHEVSFDYQTYTFHLREDAKWSNGEPVTAHDFVYAWRRAVDPEFDAVYAWYFELLAVNFAAEIRNGELPVEDLGVSAIDDHTLVVDLAKPIPYFLQGLTYIVTFPVPKDVVEEFGEDWSKPENIVSNGAYVLSQYSTGEQFKLERNEEYWDDDNTVIEEVNGYIINDIDETVERFKAGDLDIVDEVPVGQFETLKAEMPDSVFNVPYLCTYYYIVNQREDTGVAALKNQDVRQALSLAIDRDKILGEVLQSGHTAAYTFTPPETAGFIAPDVAAENMTQEERLAKAKELMSRAGYGEDGKPLDLTVLFNTSELHSKIYTEIAQMWQQAFGAEVDFASQPANDYFASIEDGKFDLARTGWCGDYNEPSTFLDLLDSASGSNHGGFSNARVDKLLEAAKFMEDPTPTYTDIEDILMEELPIIPIYHYTKDLMLNPQLEGWPMHNVQQRWYAKDFYLTK